jgi:Domain of unknown function (DUF4136)
MYLLRRMKHRNSLMPILLSALAACSPFQVSSDYDPKANFAAYRTYSWLPRIEQPDSDPRLQSSLLHSRIRDAVDAQLTSKGLRQDPTANPDLLVAYHVALQGKLEISTVPSYPYGPSVWGATQKTYTRQYDEGTLIVDLIDASNRQLVWRGSAQAEVKPDTSPQERQKRINEAVQQILERYPPR